MKRYHYHTLQGLGLLACSIFLVKLSDPVISTSLFSLSDESQTAIGEFDRLAFLKYVLSSSVGIPSLSLLD
jgi:hypothetical protein